jgi:SAM-dependent methyltransferase
MERATMTDERDRLSDLVWTRLSETDPYWSVLAIEKYHGQQLAGERKEEFFETGEQNVQHFLDVASRLRPGLRYSTVIDFGCGVGRLTIPLCRRAKQVFAVDISPTMLDLCEKNCREAGLFNVIPIKSDDDLSELNGFQADLIISSITFQHIVPTRGLPILELLVERLKPDGVLCVFLLIAGESDQPVHGIDALSVLASPETYIEMNVYPLDSVISILRNYTEQIILDLVPMGKHLGANIFCARQTTI